MLQMRISAAECDGLVTPPACRTGRRPPLTTPRTSTRTRTITTTRRTNTFAPTFAVRPSAFTSLVTSSREIIKATTTFIPTRPIQFAAFSPLFRVSLRRLFRPSLFIRFDFIVLLNEALDSPANIIGNSVYRV